MFINNFDPVALQIMSIEIRWYSLAYIFGILFGWILSKKIFISDEELKNKFDDSKNLPVVIGKPVQHKKDVFEFGKRQQPSDIKQLERKTCQFQESKLKNPFDIDAIKIYDPAPNGNCLFCCL